MLPRLGKSAFREISERGHALVRKPQDCINTWHQHHLIKLANVRWSEAEKKRKKKRHVVKEILVPYPAGQAARRLTSTRGLGKN
jgi:hypothetical protein